jgi:hypothetical protein
MKKFIYATLAAATLFASVGAASADTNTSFNDQVLAQNSGGASYGYNQTLASFDAIK